jgi:hypothetical protein
VTAQTPVTACGNLAAQNSYILTADLNIANGAAPSPAPAGTCLNLNGNGISLNLNGHSIKGFTGAVFGIVGTGNNNHLTGPGVVHDFDSCVSLGGNHQRIKDVLAYNCQTVGIWAGNFSKCVQCRVHDVRSSEGTGVGIIIGGRVTPALAGFPDLLSSFASTGGCLLESSISERSDWGAIVGRDCKVWDLVVDTVGGIGLKVGRGTSVARTVISHYHDGPGLDYRDCTVGNTDLSANGCQDSSNSVTLSTGVGALAIVDTPGVVTTDCATNGRRNGVGGGIKYAGNALPGAVGGCFPTP